MPFIHFTPITIKTLNQAIDADLLLGAAHGLTASYVRFDAFSNYQIYCNADNQYLALAGGTNNIGNGAAIELYGKDNGGHINIGTVNAAKTGVNVVCQFSGVTNTPTLGMLSHRIIDLGTPTTNGDALPYQAWTTANVTHTWGGTAPANYAYTFRYTKIGKTVYYTYQGAAAADSNATTSLGLSDLPYTAAAINYHGQWINGTGAGGLTFNDILGYVAGSTKTVAFLKWVIPTDGQPLYVQGTGFYEES